MTIKSIALRAFLAGLPGVLLIPVFLQAPNGIPAAALIVNPLILLTVLAFAGAWATGKLGLRSALLRGDDWNWLAIRNTLLAGITVGVVVGLLDNLSLPLWRSDGIDQPLSLIEAAGLDALILGVSYGGVTEEIIMRWGLMALLMVPLSKILSTGGAAMVAAVLAAVLFALGHLPSLALAEIEVTTPIFIRILLVNAGVGVWFGWLFWRTGFEAAVTAHASLHIGVFLTALVVS